MDQVIVIAVLVILVASSVAGYFLGRRKGQETAGLIMGMVLGPIGVLWVHKMQRDDPDAKRRLARRRPTCPSCGGTVGKKAKTCRHCGEAL